ncbi:MAG: hypothetical protein IMZ66_09465 [Planctomycetes bacterium]|nr:hypothetical protein [Planctomycetota bacterium]
MLAWWTWLSLAVFDALIGWVLALPWDVALVAVGLGSAAVLAVVRLFTTNQDFLRRAADDRKRLTFLIRKARRRRDTEAARRFRATRPMIALQTFRSEWRPLAVAVVPIAMLATWCLARLEFLPPRDGEPVEIVAYTPVSAAGQVMHLVPQDGLEADAWVRPVAAVTGDGPPHGMATWQVRGRAAEAPYRLAFRLKDRTVERDLLVGGRTYAQPVVDHGGQVVTELRMRPAKLLGIVPGIPALALPPWMMAYLVVVIPLVSAVKRVLRIY